jgi:isopenicillin N synthase-like dioxygenase
MVIESIPIVDFAEYKTNPKKVAQDVFEACKSIGFFYMINHDLPQKDIDRAFELVSVKQLIIGFFFLSDLLFRVKNSLICLAKKSVNT